MIILDTNIVSLLAYPAGSESERLRQRLAQFRPDEIAATIISYEEQMRGWMSVAAKARTISAEVIAYERLERFLGMWKRMNVLSFNKDAAAKFANLRRTHRRLGAMDLKIAAIALSRNAILLTANVRDFADIANLDLEGWRPAN